MRRTPISCRSAPIRRGGPSLTGFSLTEILVGAVALAVALAMAAAMNGVATRGVRSSTVINDRNAAVDADIAEIRELAEQYTWCAGEGNVGPDSGSTCLSSNPNDESYYSPAVSQAPSEAGDINRFGNANMKAFLEACSNGSLNTTLIAAINGRPLPAGLRRQVQSVQDPSSPAIPTNRLQIQYSTPANDPDPVYRTAVINPTVTGWCP